MTQFLPFIQTNSNWYTVHDMLYDKHAIDKIFCF